MRKPGHPQGVHRHKRYGQMALGIGDTLRCNAWLEINDEEGYCTRPHGHEGIHTLRTRVSKPPYLTVV